MGPGHSSVLSLQEDKGVRKERGRDDNLGHSDSDLEGFPQQGLVLTTNWDTVWDLELKRSPRASPQAFQRTWVTQGQASQ